MSVKAIPEGYSSVTPYLIVDDAELEIQFLTQALGGVEMGRTASGDKIMHAVVKINGAPIMLGSSGSYAAATTAMVFIYVTDVDATFKKAAAFEGVRVESPVADQFWGDRGGAVKTKNNIAYWIATHIEDVSHEQIAQRMAAAKPPEK